VNESEHKRKKMTTTAAAAAAAVVDVRKEERRESIAVPSDRILNGAIEEQIQRPLPAGFKLVQIPGEDDPSASNLFFFANFKSSMGF